MNEFRTGDRVKLSSGITPEIGTVFATGLARIGERAVEFAEVLWPVGSVPETTGLNGARKYHTFPELVAVTPWEKVADDIGHCDECFELAPQQSICTMHAGLLDALTEAGSGDVEPI